MLPCSFGPIAVRSAHLGDLPVIGRLMAPFVAQRELLRRTEGEMWNLLPQSFLAEVDGRAVGFAALEIYSQKLSEIQCLSYEESSLAPNVIAALLHVCLEKAREHGIIEVMAVVPPRLESTLIACGFHVILPGQKKAMFIRTGRRSTGRNESTPQALAGDVVIRPACTGDANGFGSLPLAFRRTRRASVSHRGRTTHAPASRLRGRSQGAHRRLHRAGNLF